MLAFAQENKVEKDIKNQGDIGQQQILENEFEHLITTKQLVYQLRKNYGIEGSVLLSKTLWEILTSYSNQQQAQSIWQQAINQVTEIDQGLGLSVIDSQYNLGQIIDSYTNGMTMEKWQESRQIAIINRKKLGDFFALNTDLTIYLRLNEVWQILLTDIAKQENIQWGEVFTKSLNIFEGEQQTTPKNEVLATDDYAQFIKELITWQNSDDKQRALSDLIQYIENHGLLYQPYYHTVVRFVLDKHYQHYLASALSWFSVARDFYVLKSELDENDLQQINLFIEENDAWFLSQEQPLLVVNEKLPEQVESSFHSLKAYYSDRLNTDVVLDSSSIYKLIERKIDKYMASPFRSKIRKDLEVCLNISEEFAPFPQQPIDNNQFIGCIKDMTSAAIQEAGNRELSGSLTKVGNKQALIRALQLPPWQIINILYADVAETNCLDESNHLVNPLEWSLAAESLLWFADRWPAYMQRFPQKQQINKIVKEGERLVQDFTCLNKTKQKILDSHFDQIMQAWQAVKVNIKQLIREFNQENLKSGSDIDLLTNVENHSNYRVENVKIMACDPQNSCGVHIELETSRALYGLFPNHLLVADQLKLGSLKLCYDNIGWENRRAAPTHLKNDSVANYFGNFRFSLKGFYNETLVFERQIIGDNEYLYLFAENSEAVQNTICPLSIVGQKIETQLERGTFGLVPNRLTFLTASRADESKILSLNWSSGEEWRDQLMTEEAQIVTDSKLREMSQEIQQSYQQKGKKLQDVIYHALLSKLTEPSEIQLQLSDSFVDMRISSELLLALNYLFSMDKLMINDQLHGIFYGSEKIPDMGSIKDLYQKQININLLIASIDENLKINQEKWNALSDGLSNSHINSILYRLKALDLDH